MAQRWLGGARRSGGEGRPDGGDASGKAGGVPGLPPPRDPVGTRQRGKGFGVASRILQRLGQGEADRDQVVVTGFRPLHGGLHALDVVVGEAHGLQVGQAPPGLPRPGLPGDDLPVLGRGLVHGAAVAQLVAEQGARGGLSGIQLDSPVQGSLGLVVAHAADQHHAEVEPRQGQVRLQPAGALQHLDRRIVVAGIAVDGAQGVAVQRVVRAQRHGLAHRGYGFPVLALQAVDAGTHAQYLGVAGSGRGDGRQALAGGLGPAGIQGRGRARYMLSGGVAQSLQS